MSEEKSNIHKLVPKPNFDAETQLLDAVKDAVYTVATGKMSVAQVLGVLLIAIDELSAEQDG